MRRTQHQGWITAAGIAMVVLSACGRDTYDEVDTLGVGGEVALTAEITRVSDIINDPGRYRDDTLTLVAEIDDVLSPYAFTLDEAAMIAGGLNTLLVVSSGSHPLAEFDVRWVNDTVRVTGAVRQASIIELERELGRDLAPDLELRLEGNRPILIAFSVDRMAAR